MATGDLGTAGRGADLSLTLRFRRLVPRLSSAFSPIMAWRCSASTNVELIENMARRGLINSARVRNVREIHRSADRLISVSEPAPQAMKQVDRANYVIDKRDAYDDAPQWVPISLLKQSLSPITPAKAHRPRCNNLRPTHARPRVGIPFDLPSSWVEGSRRRQRLGLPHRHISSSRLSWEWTTNGEGCRY